MYAVVEFVGSCDDGDTSNEIAVVPTKWLYKHDKRCFWPNRLGKFTKFDDLVKSNPDSKSTWPTYKVYNVHFKTEKYEDAEERLTELIRENYESETDGTNKSLSRKKMDVPEFAKDVDELMVHNLNPDLNLSLGTTLTNSSHSTLPSPSSTTNRFDEIILQQITIIKVAVEQQSILLNEILRNSRSGLGEYVPPDVPSGFPTLPFKNLEEFITFDKTVLEDEAVVKYLRSRLAAVGGSGLDHIVRRIMKTLMTSEVGCSFNWKGRGEKHPFERTNIVNIIKEAAKQNFPPNEKNDLIIENAIKDWLKYSPTRIALKKK